MRYIPMLLGDLQPGPGQDVDRCDRLLAVAYAGGNIGPLNATVLHRMKVLTDDGLCVRLHIG